MQMVERIMIFGDVHADWHFLYKVHQLAKEKHCDLLIQLGDFGIWPQMMHSLYRNSIPDILFIDGNHEHYPTLLKRQYTNGLGSINENLHHVKRGTMMQFGDLHCLFIGGAYSIDKAQREKGHDWFPEEQLTNTELNLCLAYRKADVVFSHDCPMLVNIVARDIPEAFPNREKLEMVLKKYNPHLWFFGHYHRFFNQTIGKTGFYGLEANCNTDPRAVILDVKTGKIDDIINLWPK